MEEQNLLRLQFVCLSVTPVSCFHGMATFMPVFILIFQLQRRIEEGKRFDAGQIRKVLIYLANDEPKIN